MSNPLNHDHDEARSLHRIVRAMHDGECPKCHKVHPAEDMRITTIMQDGPLFLGWKCPSCGFFISKPEAEEVMRIFGTFMDRNLAVFEKWRNERQVK